MLKKFKKLFLHTFFIDSNITDAKVTYIVDPYDRAKDIICYTPCFIEIPWEPYRKQANKAKILIEKDGYISQTVDFKIDAKKDIVRFMLLFAVIGGASGIMLAFISSTFPEYAIFTSIVLALLINRLSIGSSDLYVTLKRLTKNNVKYK